MKWTPLKRLRAATLPLIGMIAAGSLVVGCSGDKSSNPDAISVKELKNPGGLSIRDNGNGSVTLTWYGSNNEKDFDGYNVYGMKGEAKDFGLEDGQQLQLLDNAGNPIEGAKNTLALFNYDPTTKFEKVGSGAVPDSSDGKEPDIKALPVHTLAKDGTTPLLPTCKHLKATPTKCTNTTDDNVDNSAVSDSTDYAVNGPISYDVSGLTVGESYCFLVLSSESKGEKVSGTSSEMRCIVPKFSASFDMDLPATGASNNKQFKLNDYVASCTTECAAPNTTSQYVVSANGHHADDEGPIYVEYATSSVNPAFVAGKNSAILDLGAKTGLDDPSVKTDPPTLVLDSNTYQSGGVDTPIQNQGGYDIAGMSVTIKKNHVYIFAVGDSTATNPTKFHYSWIFIDGDVTPSSTSVPVKMLLTKDEM